MAKVIARYNDGDGSFMGLVHVQVDPITGKDHEYWNTTETLPEIPEGKDAFWVNGAWEYKDKPAPPPPPEPPAEQPQSSEEQPSK